MVQLFNQKISTPASQPRYVILSPDEKAITLPVRLYTQRKRICRLADCGLEALIKQ